MTTIDPQSRHAQQQDGVVPALTVLFHPHVERIGERALLGALTAGGSVRLSRLMPKFRSGSDALPLEDPHLSRSPLFLEGSALTGIDLLGAGDVLQVEVDGANVAARRRFEPEELRRGVVLELARRVVLLLHLVNDGETSETAGVDELGIVGGCEAVKHLRARIRRVAPHAVPVLLRGESGTGKELVARAIHEASKRAKESFVSVNMAAVPASTAASALFGHAKGAFTGATRAAPGYFGQADGGTIFLDEIGDTPVDVQATLLRALETGELHAVGEERPRHVDVRLIAATDANLERAVEEGSFRQALFQRLGGYTIELPPLRDRREDVGLLLLHFLKEELSRLGAAARLDLPEPGGRAWLGSWLVAAAARYDWPGNVRELRNVARQIAIDWAEEPEVLRDSIIDQLLGVEPTAHEGNAQAVAARMPDGPQVADPRLPPADPGSPARGRRRLEDIGEDQLILTLRRHGWQPAAAATDLGISRTSLYSMMQKSSRIRQANELTSAEIEGALASCDGDTAKAAARLEVSEQGLKRQMRELGLR